MPGYPAPLNH